MADYISSTLKVAAGTPATVDARVYLGAQLHTDGSNAAIAIVYGAGAATAGTEIGALRAPVASDAEDTPLMPVSVNAAGKIHVVVTGTGSYALVRYSQ